MPQATSLGINGHTSEYVAMRDSTRDNGITLQSSDNMNHRSTVAGNYTLRQEQPTKQDLTQGNE